MVRVPYTADEKATLHASLNRHRDVVLWKLEGLDDEQLRRPLVPSGTTMLGLVKHLGWVEYGWFCETFGRETEPRVYDEDDPDADLRVEADESTQDVLALYARARGAADAVIDELSVEDEGMAWFGQTVTMRWVLVHMIEETARHAGHLDILREILDSATGDHRPDPAPAPRPPGSPIGGADTSSSASTISSGRVTSSTCSAARSCAAVRAPTIGRRDPRLVAHPGQRDLGGRQVESLGGPADRLDDLGRGGLRCSADVPLEVRVTPPASPPAGRSGTCRSAPRGPAAPRAGCRGRGRSPRAPPRARSRAGAASTRPGSTRRPARPGAACWYVAACAVCQPA